MSEKILRIGNSIPLGEVEYHYTVFEVSKAHPALFVHSHQGYCHYVCSTSDYEKMGEKAFLKLEEILKMPKESSIYFDLNTRVVIKGFYPKKLDKAVTNLDSQRDLEPLEALDELNYGDSCM